MNTTRYTFLTSDEKFISSLKEEKVPVISNGDFVYETHIPVYYEGVFGNFIAEVADKTKATVAAHVFYQDLGTGESRSYMNMFCNGKWM